jgi:large subunit ribosomal protein L14
MINVGCILRVIDNSGAKFVKCLRVLGVGRRNYGKAGDTIIVSVKKRNPLKKLKKGQVVRAVIVRTCKPVVRRGGGVIRFDDNAAVIINNKNMPVATRILGAIMVEVRYKNFMKVVSLATLTL